LKKIKFLSFFESGKDKRNRIRKVEKKIEKQNRKINKKSINENEKNPGPSPAWGVWRFVAADLVGI
jgi:hypothetical protein